MKTPPYFEGLIECAPILFHFNILLLSLFYIRKQILEQIPPPPLEYTGHYLCTFAAGGHKKLVKPLRMGNRNGAKIIVNRQLMVANAFEELIAEKAPSLHRKIRHFYDSHGYPLSRLITSPLRADVVYVLMKVPECFFAFTLYLFTTNPEERIAR